MAKVLVSRELVEELLFVSEAKITDVRLGPKETIQFTITGDAVPDGDGQVDAFITERVVVRVVVKSIRFEALSRERESDEQERDTDRAERISGKG